MAHIEGTEHINRSPADVFAFLANGENNPKWWPMVLDVVHVSGRPEGLGAVYRQCMRGPMGRRVVTDYEITEYEPGSRLAFQVASRLARSHGRYVLQPTETGTRVRLSLDWEPRGLAWLFAPAIERLMPKKTAMLARLKYALEHVS